MVDYIGNWVKNRDAKKQILAKTLDKLKKSKNILEVAEDINIDITSKIDCLDCANCCKSIPPIINKTDIQRISKFLKLKPKDFEEQYIITDEDMDMIFKNSPCVFLDDDNKCFIYEVRPKSCREYPHTNNYEFVKNIKLHKNNLYYCPIVFNCIESLKLKFQI